MGGYNDMVRNLIINYCANTGADLTMRYAYPKANMQAAMTDHDYCMRPFTEYWIDEANKEKLYTSITKFHPRSVGES